MINTKSNLFILTHTLGTIHYKPIKLNHIKGKALKSCGARNPKRSKEMNGILKNF